MQAHKLQDVLARVVAWHNRHPLARRIQAHQVHSVGEVRLPFAADSSPPAAPQAAPPPQALVADRPDTPAQPDRPAPTAEPEAQTQAEAAAEAELADALAEIRAGTQPETPPEPDAADTDAPGSAAPDGGAQPQPAPADSATEAPEANAPPDLAEPAQADEDADADAEVELIVPTAEQEPGNAPDPADEPGPMDPPSPDQPTADAPAPEPTPADAPPAPAPQDEAKPEPDPTSVEEIEAETEHATERDDEATPPPPDGPEPASLAARLQAARSAAQGGDHPTDGAQAPEHLDDRLADTPPAPKPSAAVAPAALSGGPAPATALHWWQRAWRALRPGARHTAAQAAAGSRPAWNPGRLTALFKDSFMWPIGAAKLARWARRHGALTPVAPSDWPRRAVATDAAARQTARAAGQAHTVQLHMITAAIGVGDRRIRLLLDAQGEVLGPRAYDPRRLAAAAGGGMALLGLVAVLLVAMRPPGADDGPVLAAASASAPEMATSVPHAEQDEAAASPHQGGASAADPAGHQTAAATPAADQASGPAHHATPDGAPDTAYAGEATGVTPLDMAQAAEHAPTTALASATGPGPRSAEPDAATARLPPGVTSTQPPRFPQRRASGPVAQVRPMLSSEERLLARQQSEAARAAARGDTAAAPPPSSAASTYTRYAVLSPALADRGEAEAQLAPMLSVRAQLPSPGPAFTELVQQNGRWRAAQWPFATAADADRARSMMASRGVKAEVMGF